MNSLLHIIILGKTFAISQALLNLNIIAVEKFQFISIRVSAMEFVSYFLNTRLDSNLYLVVIGYYLFHTR